MPGKRTPYLVAAALVVAGAAVGLVVGLSGGSSKKKATSTRQVTHIVTALLAPPPSDAAPQVSPVQAVFDPTQKATFYTVSVQAQAGTDVTYAWHLAPPPGDPACSKLTTLPGAANRAVWHVAG
ncbi:MAG: hypothetical protein JO017_01630, partial [Actinobacteria bacterium]|nr:hypothetical protein [Actinomycetota bacterium]